MTWQPAGTFQHLDIHGWRPAPTPPLWRHLDPGSVRSNNRRTQPTDCESLQDPVHGVTEHELAMPGRGVAGRAINVDRQSKDVGSPSRVVPLLALPPWTSVRRRTPASVFSRSDDSRVAFLPRLVFSRGQRSRQLHQRRAQLRQTSSVAARSSTFAVQSRRRALPSRSQLRSASEACVCLRSRM